MNWLTGWRTVTPDRPPIVQTQPSVTTPLRAALQPLAKRYGATARSAVWQIGTETILPVKQLNARLTRYLSGVRRLTLPEWVFCGTGCKMAISDIGAGWNMWSRQFSVAVVPYKTQMLTLYGLEVCAFDKRALRSLTFHSIDSPWNYYLKPLIWNLWKHVMKCSIVNYLVWLIERYNKFIVLNGYCG